MTLYVDGDALVIGPAAERVDLAAVRRWHLHESPRGGGFLMLSSQESAATRCLRLPAMAPGELGALKQQLTDYFAAREQAMSPLQPTALEQMEASWQRVKVAAKEGWERRGEYDDDDDDNDISWAIVEAVVNVFLDD